MSKQRIEAKISEYNHALFNNLVFDQFYIFGYRIVDSNNFRIARKEQDKATSHIQSIYFHECFILDFPRPQILLDLVKNLTCLLITESNLTKIDCDDLKGLGSLEELYLGGNVIEKLPKGLFHYTPHLRIVSFRDNQIKEIDAKILNPIKDLKYFNLIRNVCISVRYDGINNQGNVTLPQLKEMLKMCDPKFKEKFYVKINKKRFRVDKEVLVTNSAVFERMISINGYANSIELSEISEEIFLEILKFITMKKSPSNEVNLFQLFVASVRFEIRELTDLIADLLIRNITPGTARDTINLFKKFGYDELIKKASEELERKMSNVTSLVVYDESYYSIDYLFSKSCENKS